MNVVSAISPNKDFKITKLNLLLDQVKAYFDNRDIACKTKLLDVGTKMDSIANNLLDYADDQNGDLLVIMIQQENQIRERIIGSLARKVIMGSNIPVLSLKPEISVNKEDIIL